MLLLDYLESGLLAQEAGSTAENVPVTWKSASTRPTPRALARKTYARAGQILPKGLGISGT
jgi:hypothetical protein